MSDPGAGRGRGLLCVFLVFALPAGNSLVFALAGCSSNGIVDDAASPSDQALEQARDAVVGEPLTHLEVLASPDDYERLKGAREQIKYLLRVDGRSAPAPLDAECIFQNTSRWEYHLLFIRSFAELSDVDLDAYTAMALLAASRVWWGGLVRSWPDRPHPRTGRQGLISYSVWHEPGSEEQLAVAQFVEVDRRVKRCIPYAAGSLVLLPDGEQVAHVLAIHDELVAAQIDVLFP